MGFAARVIVNAVMIYLAARVVPGITLDDGPVWPALLAGLVLALVNPGGRPVVMLIPLPLTLLTLGLFLLGLDAVCRGRAWPLGPGVAAPCLDARVSRR